MQPMDVYVEAGSKRTFAGSLEWPGCVGSGRDEPSALRRSSRTHPLCGRAEESRLGFEPPGDLRVVERLRGDATTDFGAPDRALRGRRADDRGRSPPRADGLPACWRAFDATADEATDKELRRDRAAAAVSLTGSSSTSSGRTPGTSV
jgi:hypothetical protein